MNELRRFHNDVAEAMSIGSCVPAEQRMIADAFADAHLVPGMLDVRDVPVWHPATPS